MVHTRSPASANTTDLREFWRLVRPPLTQVQLVTIDQVVGRIVVQLVCHGDDVASILRRHQIDRASRLRVDDFRLLACPSVRRAPESP